MVFLFDNHGQRVKLGHVEACPAPTRPVPILIPSAPTIAHEEHLPDIPRPKESFEKFPGSKVRIGNLDLQSAKGNYQSDLYLCLFG